MKNEEQRIWNKSELEAHPDWRVGRVAYLGTWINDKSEYCITADMVGQTVQWCEEQGYTVTDEMIARTETLESLQLEKARIEEIIDESDCSTDMLVNFTKDLETVNGKIKTLTEQPKTAIAANGHSITLENGNPSFEEWLNKYFAKPKLKLMYKTFYNGKEYSEEELIKRYKKAYRINKNH